jgi:hypothetical protein
MDPNNVVPDFHFIANVLSQPSSLATSVMVVVMMDPVKVRGHVA